MISATRLENTITLEDVIDIHTEVIANSGGLDGLSGDKSLESALFRIDHRIHYEDLNDPFKIAAWYGYAIARGHTFIDGNKRTAFICMFSYLEAKQINVSPKESEEELANFMEELAVGNISVNNLSKWLKDSSMSPG